jgi:hypothetical protein
LVQSKTEGAADMKNLLGGKGANLAEMCRLGHFRTAWLHDQHRSLYRLSQSKALTAVLAS